MLVMSSTAYVCRNRADPSLAWQRDLADLHQLDFEQLDWARGGPKDILTKVLEVSW